LTSITAAPLAAKEAFMAASTFEQRPFGALGRMTVVAGIHLAVFYCIAAGLGIAPKLAPLMTEPVTPIDTAPPDERPPDIPVVIEQSVPYVPMPDIPFDAPTDSTITADVRPIDQIPVEPMAGSAVTEIPATGVMQDSRYPLTQPAYPPAAKRDNEQGAGIVEVLVLPSGRVGDVRMASTTGFERLDKAALLEARQSWRFKPATRAGEAVAQWYRVKVVFKLTDQR
jgi:periplasmic protein TonB